MSSESTSPTPVDIRKAERRSLHFDSLAEALADVRTLAAGPVRATGNRTPSDLVHHLAQAVEVYVAGIDPKTIPLPLRVIGKVARPLVRHMMLDRPMSPGFKMPKRMQETFYGEDDGDLDGAIARYAAAIDTLEAAQTLPRHPVLGDLPPEQARWLHCRHAELHLSFLHPQAPA